jgi:hypothetical protein
MNLLPLSGDHGSSAEAAIIRLRLESICTEPALHARFLNTLSLLEHIGSRKIMLSRAGDADGGLLKHLAEETRHAWFFKRAAEKLARRALDYGAGSTLAGPAARFYMGRLDARISDALRSGDDSLPYLYMSLIIEDRAIWAYRIYQGVLAEQNRGISLVSVLAEENLHLKAMLAEIHVRDDAARNRIDALCAVEHAEFGRLWRAIELGCATIREAAQ